MPVAQVPPPPPRVRLCLGITGHRDAHPQFAANRARIEAALTEVLDLIAAATAAVTPPFGGTLAPTRLHSLLADGADQLAATQALLRQWDLVAPLPFGAALNRAINALPQNAADAGAVLSGTPPADPAVAARAEAITALMAKAQVFELADDDDDLTPAFLASFDTSADPATTAAFAADTSARVALAARLMIEQSDLLIAIWDGTRTSFVGGTGDTVATALGMGSDVIWIDPAEPEAWRVLGAPEALCALRAAPTGPDRAGQIARMVRAALLADADQPPKHDRQGSAALEAKHWHPRSTRFWHAYRRVEALFSGERGKNPWRDLRQTYEPPEAIAAGSGAQVLAATRALPGTSPTFSDAIAGSVMARFAWADGIATNLSDTYRSGMIINFLLSACAIIGGVAYLPLTGGQIKWPFALFELVLLSAIVFITFQGQKRGWHSRWFETRRVAEYLRHAPLLLALGAARNPGRWPRGSETSWPEHYARHTLREVGLPQAIVSAGYLRHALTELLDKHVTVQRDYHHAKAKKLTAVHHNLDKVSEAMFQLAVAAVLVYLVLFLVGEAGWLKHKTVETAAKVFTFLGVMLPTIGGAIAGIRYFGDFERFAAISEITAGKLDAVHDRIKVLLKAPDSAMDYGPVAELAHAADDIVVSEIENWQAVFGGKHITVPV